MNIILDTEQCNRIADALANLQQSQYFADSSLQVRDQQIQNQIHLIENFFRRLSTMVENNEEQIVANQQIYVGSKTGWTMDANASGSIPSLLKGRTANANLNLAYTGMLVGATKSVGPFFGRAGISAIEGNVLGKANFRVVKNKKLYPEMKVQLQGDAHLAAASAMGGVNLGMVQSSIQTTAEVGAVYGNATAVLSPDQQVLSAQVGAAAVRGECVLAIQLADIKVTIGVSGSLGSVEAGVHYSNEPGSWEIGANGALFAGGGLRIRVDY